jgi:hypothetical protein
VSRLAKTNCGGFYAVTREDPRVAAAERDVAGLRERASKLAADITVMIDVSLVRSQGW